MKNVGSTFYRNLLSFVLVLLLLTSGIYAVSITYLTHETSARFAQSVQSTLAQAEAAISADLWQMMNISYLIHKDAAIKNLNENSTVVERRQASAAIALYSAVCDFSDVICCYLPASPYVFLPTESITPSLFIGQQYEYTNHTLSDLENVITSDKGIDVWAEDIVLTPGKKPKPYITVFISVLDRPAHSRIRTMFLIPSSNFEAHFASLSGNTGFSLCLIDPQGQVFYSTGDTQVINTLSSLDSAKPDGQISLRSIDKRDYYTYNLQTTVGGWTIAAALSTESAQPVSPSLLLSITAVVFCFDLMACIIFFLLARHNYRPIQRLLKTTFPQGGVPAKLNEIDAVEQEMKRLNSQCDQLYRSLRLQSDASRQTLISKLLNGGESPDKLMQLANACQVELDGDAFAVMALYIDGYRESNHTTAQMAEYVARFFSNMPQTLLHSDDFEPNRFTLILTLTNGDTLDSITIPLQEYLEQTLGMSVAIGCSIIGKAYTELPSLYQQACQALDLRVVQGKHSVHTYQEEETVSQAMVMYNTNEMEKLQWYLMQLDEENTARVMDTLIERLRQGNLSVSAVRMICYDIVNTIVRCLNSLWKEKDFIVPPQIMEELVAFDTVEQLTQTLKRLIYDTCSSIRERQNPHNKRIEVLTDYLHAHYCDANLTVSAVADHFQLSVSNLSHFFKASTGKTLASYLQELRFSESCRLLAETDLSVQEICDRIGMLNVSNFIRRFKQLYGITPGAYRTAHRK